MLSMHECYYLESENIYGDNFKQLVDLLGLSADYFTMNKHFTSNGKPFFQGSLFKTLAPFCIDSLQVNDWYCNYDMSSFYTDNTTEYRIEVQVYQSNNMTLDILKSSCDNIYLFDYEQIPLGEDLCFFKDNKLFMGTVSHERICGVYSLTEEMSQKLQRYGTWGRSAYDDINRISLR